MLLGLGVEAWTLRLLDDHTSTSDPSPFACSSPRLCAWGDSLHFQDEGHEVKGLHYLFGVRSLGMQTVAIRSTSPMLHITFLLDSVLSAGCHPSQLQRVDGDGGAHCLSMGS